MLKNKPLKLVIDTNLWISFIISKKLDRLFGPYKKEEYLLKRKELGVPEELQL